MLKPSLGIISISVLTVVVITGLALRLRGRDGAPPSPEMAAGSPVPGRSSAPAVDRDSSMDSFPSRVGAAPDPLAQLLLRPPGLDTLTAEGLRENTSSAIELLTTAARNGDKTLLSQIAALPKSCPGCEEFFSKARELFNDSELSSDERIYLASALAASGRVDNQRFLYDQFRQAAADPGAAAVPAATIARQLERNQQGGPLAGEVVDEVANDLSSENPYVRDAAISLLTRQNSREAAQRLYEYTVQNADRDGFYRQGMGLGLMNPAPDAFPYLEELVRKQDQYSHLALKALLNAGADGIMRAVNLLDQVQTSGPNRALIQGAVDHIPLYGPMLQYMQGLQKSPNPTVQELASEVVREYNSREAALRKGIEYNDNYASGIIMPTPGAF